MPIGLPKEQAAALRARINVYLADAPRGSPKKTAMRKAVGESNFGSFLKGTRGLSRESAAKAEAILDGATTAPTPAPTQAPAPNRKPVTPRHERISPAESNRLRAEIKRRFPKLADFMRAMGVTPTASADWYRKIKGDMEISTVAAARMRAALDGKAAPRPKASPNDRDVGPRIRLPDVEANALRADVRAFMQAKSMSTTAFGTLMGGSYNSFSDVLRGHRPMTVRLAQRLRAAIGAPSTDLVHVPPAKRSPRASRDVLAKLRLDLGHVLATQYGGKVPQLAHAIGLTAGRLDRFLDGGALTLEESRGVSEHLSALQRSPVQLVTRAVSMNRAGFADQHEPPEVRARNLVARWGQEAIEIVLQLANLGAA